mgnify:CR=1 FL=1
MSKTIEFNIENSSHRRCINRSGVNGVNRIRWDREIETQGGDFKISNDYISFYARLFHARHPQHKGFFRTKPFKEEKLIEKLGEALDF